MSMLAAVMERSTPPTARVFGNGDLHGEVCELAADVTDHQVLRGEVGEGLRWVDLVAPGCGDQLVIDDQGQARRRAHLSPAM